MDITELFELKENESLPKRDFQRKKIDVNVENILHESPSKGKKSVFQTQYHELYNTRLKTLKTIFKEKKLKNKTITPNLTSMELEQPTWVIVNITKHYKNKMSYLKILEDSKSTYLYPEIQGFSPSEFDVIYGEDETGRRKLNLEDAVLIFDEGYPNIKENVQDFLINGIIVAFYGVLDSRNSVKVEKILLPGIPESHSDMVEEIVNEENEDELKDIRDLRKRIQEEGGEKVNLVALISGLEVNCSKEENGNFKELSLLFDDLAGGEGNRDIMERISGTLILGNSINVNHGINLSLLGSYAHETEFEEMQKTVSESLQLLDEEILNISKNQKVILLPGDKDPSDGFLPQRPLSMAMFIENWKIRNRNLKLCSNPSLCSLEGKIILATSGQNIEDIVKNTPVITHFNLFFRV